MMLKTILHESIIKEFGCGMGVWEVDGMNLAYLASHVPGNGVIVEIGSARGKSAAFMAAALKPDSGARIFCIDLWDNPDSKKPGLMSDAGDLLELKNKLALLGLMEFITIIKGESVKEASRWRLPIDLLFIDGDHTYKGVKADYEAWYPHVKVGGVIALHDYHPNKWGVKKFVDETVSKQLKFLGMNGLERVIWSGEKV